jgi:hypothetical protein
MLIYKLTSETLLGKGWVRVELTSNTLVPGVALGSLERPGYRERFLGEKGWQVASYLFELELTSLQVDGVLSFLMGPETVQHMHSGSNYQLTILKHDGATTQGSCALPWKGIPPYVPPKGKGGPWPTVAPEPMAKPKPKPLESEGVVWPTSPGTLAIEMPDSPPVVPDSIAPELPDSIPTPPENIVKIECRHCGNKIFSNMVFCPLCSQSL